MNDLILYILKSTLCLSLFYLAFRTMMRKETFFALNRMVVLIVVVCSIIIPLLHLPQSVPPLIREQVISQIQFNDIPMQPTEVVESPISAALSNTSSEAKLLPYSTMQIFQFIYLAGILVSLLYFIHGIIYVLLMLRKAQPIKKEGYRLFILEKDIPAFSFGKMVFISQTDYRDHGTTILAHEQQHIRLGHFYDLLLMEMAKMIHWFNPVIYLLIQDLKAIHEYQADRHTLTKGIDATHYQLLIIEKGVGPQRLALANSFNHCQIKKRITMMNKQMTSRAGYWKVATFLPLLALLLMAFGKTGESMPIKGITFPEIIQEQQSPQSYLSIEIRKDGNYIENKLCSLNEISRKADFWQKSNADEALILWAMIPAPDSRLSEVKEVLKKAKVQNIDVRIVYSGETINQPIDVLPEFPGGSLALRKLIAQSIKYPGNTLKNLTQEKVYVSFVINTEGMVVDPAIVKGINPELDAEALRVVSLLPKWKPGKKDGRTMNVNYYMPITFGPQ